MGQNQQVQNSNKYNKSSTLRIIIWLLISINCSGDQFFNFIHWSFPLNNISKNSNESSY